MNTKNKRKYKKKTLLAFKEAKTISRDSTVEIYSSIEELNEALDQK